MHVLEDFDAYYSKLIHVYAKNYEANGQTLLIRIVRYSLDGLSQILTAYLGLILTQVRPAQYEMGTG